MRWMFLDCPSKSLYCEASLRDPSFPLEMRQIARQQYGCICDITYLVSSSTDDNGNKSGRAWTDCMAELQVVAVSLQRNTSC